MADRALPSPSIPRAVLARAAAWTSMKRWERRELGRELRALGLSYGEIARVIPVSKGTLSGWCRDVVLGEEVRARLAANSGPGRALGAEANRRKRGAQVEAIKRAATAEAARRSGDPLWVAGVMLYWGEGTKSHGLRITNSDPELIRLAMAWFRRCLDVEDDRFSVALHLHTGQDELAAKAFWADVTALPVHTFLRTHFKGEGSGHRRNILHRGTAQVRIKRSGDLLHRVLGWIEAWYPSDGPLAKSVIATDS